VLHNGIPTLFSEVRLIANENVRRPQLFPLNFGHESLGLRKGAHQKASSTFETSVLANSLESLWNAGESSSKKLLNSCET
jgi:hypothetical protein